ncbi:MAG: hypothetical protein R6U19_01415 [Bacteroidales bacterium]
MRAFLLFALAGILSFCLHAQEDDVLMSKKGIPVLPQAGDYALGVDASPFFDLAGNLIKINSGSVFNDPSSFDFVTSDNTVFGKYFVSSELAYRGKIRIGYHTRTMKNMVTDDTYDGDPGDYDPAEDDVMDKYVESFSTVTLGAGIEKRRGYGRLQGFYGAEVLLMYRNGGPSDPNENYSYGNEFDEDNNSPTTTTDFVNGIASPVSSRTLNVKQGASFGLGARVFAGVEYFFLPKMSLGGEFGWGLHFMTRGKSKTTTEAWDGAEDEVIEVESHEANGGEFHLDTDNFGGQIFLMFHF